MPRYVDLAVQKCGVEILQPEKDRCIYLGRDAYVCLCAFEPQLQAAMDSQHDLSLILDEKKDIRATVGTFNSKPYLNIRVWWNDHPTKQGVSLNNDEWADLASQLETREEMRMGAQVLTELLREEVQKAVRDGCEGCKHDWPSQRDHDCLMEPGKTALVERSFDKVWEEVDYSKFIFLLAEEAHREKFVLEMPKRTLMTLCMVHKKNLKEKIVASF